MKWLTTCKETTVLASRALDTRLSLGQRVALRLHLAVCGNCARFARQLREMRRRFRLETAEDDAPGLPEEARQRIAEMLHKKLDR